MTEQNEQRMELYMAGCTDREIGDRLGYSERAIGYWRRKNGLEPNRPPEKPSDERRMELYRAGYTDRQIARAEGRAPQTINDWRRRRGLEPNKKPTAATRRKEGRGIHRNINAAAAQARGDKGKPPIAVTDEAIRRKYYAAGKPTDKQIAAMLCISAAHVRDFRLRHGLPANPGKEGNLCDGPAVCQGCLYAGKANGLFSCEYMDMTGHTKLSVWKRGEVDPYRGHCAARQAKGERP